MRSGILGHMANMPTNGVNGHLPGDALAAGRLPGKQGCCQPDDIDSLLFIIFGGKDCLTLGKKNLNKIILTNIETANVIFYFLNLSAELKKKRIFKYCVKVNAISNEMYF